MYVHMLTRTCTGSRVHQHDSDVLKRPAAPVGLIQGDKHTQQLHQPTSDTDSVLRENAEWTLLASGHGRYYVHF